MKLLNVLPTLALSEWIQPNYFDALAASKQRKSGWGHPLIRAAADWSLCPTLEKPAGVASISCDGATCMSVCEPGKIGTGKRRTKCRFKKNKGFFWKRVTTTILLSFTIQLFSAIGAM